MTTVICLTGFHSVGKNYVANKFCKRFRENTDKDIKIYHFAKKLKQICKILFNFTYEQLHGNLKNQLCPIWKVTPRDMFEYVGTDLFQTDIQKKIPELHRNFWATSLISDFKQDKSTIKVIADLRFIHEYEMLRERFDKVVVIRVINEDSRMHSRVEQSHLMIPMDYTIFNSKRNPAYHTELCIERIAKELSLY